MGIVTGIVTFLIIWWTTLFVILPIGARSQADAGSVVAGSEPGAPAAANLPRKLRTTTAVAFALFIVVFLIVEYSGLTLEDIPIGPDLR